MSVPLIFDVDTFGLQYCSDAANTHMCTILHSTPSIVYYNTDNTVCMSCRLLRLCYPDKLVMRHVNAEDLAVILVDRGMVDDHLPNNVLTALKKCQQQVSRGRPSPQSPHHQQLRQNGGGAVEVTLEGEGHQNGGGTLEGEGHQNGGGGVVRGELELVRTEQPTGTGIVRRSMSAEQEVEVDVSVV